MEKTTRQLIELAERTHYEHLSATDIHECKRRVIDSIACAIGSFDHEQSVGMRALANQYRGAAPATIWGTNHKTTAEMAALANGVMLRVGENSDTFIGRGGGGHPSDMIGGLVAVAESTRASGESLIAAIVLAYDVYCQLMQVAQLGKFGWDQAVHACLGSALGAGQLLGLNEQQMRHAISLAITPNMALRQTRHGELANWKACAGPNAAKNGIFAAIMAKNGLEGPAEIFEGKQGLWSVTDRFEWPATPTPGSPRMIRQTSIKSLPVCYHTQSAGLGALELLPQVQGSTMDEIHVETYATAVEMAAGDPGQWAPKTQESADHSLPFVVATALVRKSIRPEWFAVEQLQDAQVLALLPKIKVSLNPALDARWPETAPAKLSIRCGDRTYTKEVIYPRGHVLNPMTDEELNQKFIQSCEAQMNEESVAKALGALWNIEKATDLNGEVLQHLILPQY